MPLQPSVKQQVVKKIEEYEGRINHFYLDSLGKVTVGIGHLVASKAGVSSITMYTAGNNLPARSASLQDKQAEYDHIARQQKGRVASWYKQHAKLMMKDRDINILMERHLDSFYRDLANIYRKSKGYPEDFDHLPQKVQMALFDMIFNLGAQRLVSSFPSLNNCIKAGDWSKAAQQCNRPQVSVARNQYVIQLFLSAAREEVMA
jgi:GH24 family phage-related lysozyme (muramidase)